MSKKLILFDLDGTLMQTFYGDDNSYMRALSEIIEVDFNLKYWTDCPNLTDSAVLDHIFLKIEDRSPSPEEVALMKAKFLGKMEEKLQNQPQFFDEIPGALALVNHLLTLDNVLVGVATGGWKHIAEFKLSHGQFPLEQLAVIGSDDHFAKADFVSALMENQLAEKGMASFSSVTYIGDSRYDMRMAEQLGLHFIGVDHKETGFLKQEGAQVVVKNFADLDSFLRLLDL